jgi:hypothetical protein
MSRRTWENEGTAFDDSGPDPGVEDEPDNAFP